MKICKKYQIKIKSKKFKNTSSKHLKFNFKKKKFITKQIEPNEKKFLNLFNYYKREIKIFHIEKDSSKNKINNKILLNPNLVVKKERIKSIKKTSIWNVSKKSIKNIIKTNSDSNLNNINFINSNNNSAFSRRKFESFDKEKNDTKFINSTYILDLFIFKPNKVLNSLENPNKNSNLLIFPNFTNRNKKLIAEENKIHSIPDKNTLFEIIKLNENENNLNLNNNISFNDFAKVIFSELIKTIIFNEKIITLLKTNNYSSLDINQYFLRNLFFSQNYTLPNN